MKNNIKQYNFFCNFCGSQFTAARWDAKTCTMGCRTRLSRIERFFDGNTNVYCIICGKKHNPHLTPESAAPQQDTLPTESVVQQQDLQPVIDKICCSDECKGILNDLKIYGVTDKINVRIKKAINNHQEKEEGQILEL